MNESKEVEERDDKKNSDRKGKSKKKNKKEKEKEASKPVTEEERKKRLSMAEELWFPKPAKIEYSAEDKEIKRWLRDKKIFSGMPITFATLDQVK